MPISRNLASALPFSIVCTLAILRGLSPSLPLVVAANRDEFYLRAAAAPTRLADPPGVVAGRDLEAGGTWLGCRTDGEPLVAGILNRRPVDGSGAAGSGERSRGLLCLDALARPDLSSALAYVSAQDPSRYGGFNLLLADRTRAVVVDNGDGVRVTELGPGLSLLTNLDVNDPRCSRLASAVPAFERVADRVEQGAESDEVVRACATVLASHENSLDANDRNPFSRVCVHTELYGTCSSTVIVCDDTGRVAYFHADGPPCRAALRRID